jgi:hypothetical protein
MPRLLLIPLGAALALGDIYTHAYLGAVPRAPAR